MQGGKTGGQVPRCRCFPGKGALSRGSRTAERCVPPPSHFPSKPLRGWGATGADRSTPTRPGSYPAGVRLLPGGRWRPCRAGRQGETPPGPIPRRFRSPPSPERGGPRRESRRPGACRRPRRERRRGTARRPGRATATAPGGIAYPTSAFLANRRSPRTATGSRSTRASGTLPCPPDPWLVTTLHPVSSNGTAFTVGRAVTSRFLFPVTGSWPEEAETLGQNGLPRRRKDEVGVGRDLNRASVLVVGVGVDVHQAQVPRCPRKGFVGRKDDDRTGAGDKNVRVPPLPGAAEDLGGRDHDAVRPALFLHQRVVHPVRGGGNAVRGPGDVGTVQSVEFEIRQGAGAGAPRHGGEEERRPGASRDGGAVQGDPSVVDAKRVRDPLPARVGNPGRAVRR